MALPPELQTSIASLRAKHRALIEAVQACRDALEGVGLMRLTPLLLCAALVGCSDSPEPQIDSAFFEVHILDEPKPDWGPGVVAMTRAGSTGISHIEILRPYYPECITHEVRHVFEGDWHDRSTTCR